MKAVLMSIKPKYCELIARGEKTVEVRKSKPKLETPFKVYIYCTVGGIKKMPRDYLAEHFERGKVIGEFVCDKFTYIEAGYDTNGNKHLYNTAFIEHRMCIPDIELFDYLYKSRENYRGWAWHISDLVIYDKPKDLDYFRKPIDCHRGKDRENCKGCWNCEITRPPQSWCYVEEMG